MTFTDLIPVRTVNLVAPLAQKATDMHTTDTAATAQARSGAASPLIGAITLIATHAHSTRARCQSDYMRLTPANSFGYTPAKSTAKKAVAGCRSPKARGAEPHPARFAAFLFLATSFGGPNGRAQALPVTLRVPRSPTPVRAAAQCRSWSAVVHLARLEINMAQIIEHPHAHSDRITQTRKAGRLPKSVISLRTVKRNGCFSRYEAQCLQEEIANTLNAAAEWEKVGLALRLKAEALKQRARSARS